MWGKHNIWYWFVWALLAVWQLPQFLVSIVLIPFMGRLEVVADEHYNVCFRGEKMKGGISLGPLSFVSKYSGPASICHEFNGHTVDSKWMGPLYLIIIGVPSILNAWLGFTKCYYDFYTEKWANKHAGLGANKKGYLYFKKK